MRIENEERSNIFVVRQLLNVAFILAALAGMACYIWGDKQVGIYIALGAMILKMTESAIRMMKL